MKTVVFGKVALRLSSASMENCDYADRFGVSFFGNEVITAAGLTGLGADCDFVTCLPDSAVGRIAENYLRKYGLNTDQIVREGDFLAFYCPNGGGFSKNALSSLASVNENTFCWQKILHGAKWFHFSLGTALLGEGALACCMRALRCAAEENVTVSCELRLEDVQKNGVNIEKTLKKILPSVHMLIAEKEAFSDIRREETAEQYVHALAEECGTRITALLRKTDEKWEASVVEYQSPQQAEKTYCLFGKAESAENFSSAIIFTYLSGRSLRRIKEFAEVANCLIHNMEREYEVFLNARRELLRAEKV